MTNVHIDRNDSQMVYLCTHKISQLVIAVLISNFETLSGILHGNADHYREQVPSLIQRHIGTSLELL